MLGRGSSSQTTPSASSGLRLFLRMGHSPGDQIVQVLRQPYGAPFQAGWWKVCPKTVARSQR